MREIKFEYGFNSVNGLVKKVYYLNEIPFMHDKCDVWNVLPFVYVRQFTGLKDKNGKDIYEGDVCTFDFLKELNNSIQLIGSFIWNNDELRYEIDIHKHDDYVCLSYCENGIMRNFEIIGNIYENPELLK